MDAAGYKHVVLGLIFLTYISDAFEAHRATLESERDQGADSQDSASSPPPKARRAGSSPPSAASSSRFPGLKADFILANPPFNTTRWGGEHLRDACRWNVGVPPAGNAHFAWVQHMTPRFEHSPATEGILPKGHAHPDTCSKGVVGRPPAGVTR